MKSIRSLNVDLVNESISLSNLCIDTIVVYSEYDSNDDSIFPVDKNETNTRYSFEAGAISPHKLINSFENILNYTGKIDPEELKQFISTFGLLGFEALTLVDKTVNWYHPQDSFKGDPKWWIEEHINNVIICMQLKHLIDKINLCTGYLGDEDSVKRDKLTIELRTQLISLFDVNNSRSKQTHLDSENQFGLDNGPKSYLVDVIGDKKVQAFEKCFLIGTKYTRFFISHPLLYYPESKTVEWAIDVICMILRNCEYTTWRATKRGDAIINGIHFNSLLSLLYFKLSQVMTNSKLQKCKADDCSNVFIPTRTNQFYCPSGSKKKSKCVKRSNSRSLRARESPNEQEV